MLDFASDNVKNEGVAGDFLVWLDLDYVTRLDTAPVADLETFVPLRKYKLFHRFAIDFFCGLFQLFVMKEIQAASGYDTGNCDKENMGIISRLPLAWYRLWAEVK